MDDDTMTPVRFGIGVVEGVVVGPSRLATDPNLVGPSFIVLADSLAELTLRSLNPLVVGALVREEVSAYSHRASEIWRLGIPVLCGVTDLPVVEGQLLEVDFGSALIRGAEVRWAPLRRPAAIVPPGNDRSGRLLVWGEVEETADISKCVEGDGIGIIDADDLARMKPAAARCLAHEAEAVSSDPLAIRFFDRHPSGEDDDSFGGRRGARLLTSEVVVEAFHRLVDSLELRQAPVLVLPMVTEAEDVQCFRELTESLGGGWGATIECPAAAVLADDIVARCDLVEVGLNDLTQFTVAWDRDIPNDQLLPTEHFGPGVPTLLERVADATNRAQIPTSLGLDLWPTYELADEICALGFQAISCPASLVRQWMEVISGFQQDA